MRKLLLILLLCPLFITQCFAQDLPERIGELSGTDRLSEDLPKDVRQISGDLRLDGGYDTEGALRRLWEHALKSIRTQLSASFHAAAELFLVALLCAVSACFCSNNRMREIIDRIGCCTISVLISGSLTEMFTHAADIVGRLSEYSHAVLPVLFMTAAAGGGVLSASARFASACLSMDVLITASQTIVLPLIYVFFSLSVCQGLYENSILQTAAKMSKWCATTAMTVLTTAFGIYLSITGLITGSSNALSVKTARTLISRSLPVVGALLADSASVLLAAAGIVKNSVGVFAMISVSAFCLEPVVSFSVRLLIYKGMATAVDFMPGARLPKLINAMGSVYGMMLGLIGCCAAILFMSIVSGIKVISLT